MKKLILLLFIPIFFACSDNSSDNSNQLFLDIYDGVVWIVSNSDDPGHIDGRITFSNNPNGYTRYLAQDDLCVEVVFGQTYGDPTGEQITITIHNESENILTLKQEETGEPDLYFSFTAASNGNSLIYEVDYGNGDITQDIYVLYSGFNSCE